MDIEPLVLSDIGFQFWITMSLNVLLLAGLGFVVYRLLRPLLKR